MKQAVVAVFMRDQVWIQSAGCGRMCQTNVLLASVEYRAKTAIHIPRATII